MRIALINSPSLADRPVSRSMAGGLGFDGSEEMILPPLDLAIMAATLRQAGDTVELIDADPMRLTPADIHARLGGTRWDLLIATVSLPTLSYDASFIASLRQHHPGATIVAKTLIQDHAALKALLVLSKADFVIYGEADLTITDLAHGRTRQGSAWLEVDPAENTAVFRYEEGAPVEDMNQLPFPARDLLPNDRYVYPLLGRPVATLQTSRGCPYPCRYYCPYPLVEGVKWRAQTAERVFAELKEIVEKHGITKIYFRDATFTLKQDRVAKLCDLIVAAGWALEWVCETRIDCVSDTLLNKMRQAGCVGLLVGVETGDERVMHLPEGKKGLTVHKLASVREKTRQLGMRLHFLLIVGLPQETRESIVATYDLIQRYKPDTIGVTIITPYPGTPLYVQGLREGWIDSHAWEEYGGHQVPMHTPNLTKEDMETGKRFLEEGFALLQRRQVGGHSAPLEALAKAHYETLLRWAYRLDPVIAQLRKLLPSADVFDPGPAPAAPTATPHAGVASLADRPAGDSAVTLSVVVPTYNRQAILRKTLLAFASQTAPPDRFEVLVVDDGSSDDTLRMLERFKAPFALRVFTQQHQGANAARNLAIREARGELVLLTGDDMIPEPTFVEAHITFHAEHPDELDAMLGFIDWSPEITVTPFMRFLVSPDGGHQFSFHLAQDGKADFRLFYTSNISLKRSLLDKQPMVFDPDFTYPAYDDTELGYRLSKQGMKIHYNAKATTNHHHEMTVQSMAQRQRQAGRMALVLVKKHPELERIMPLGIEDVANAPNLYTEQNLQSILAALAEVEKPSLDGLKQIHANGTGYDVFYARHILYPLYHAVLRTAYGLGIRDAMQRSNEGRKAGRAADGDRRAYAVSIVIPVWNKMELTVQCLTKLAEATKGIEYEVIVVDNHSTDGTAEFLRQLSGDVRIIRNEANLGFAKACNQGARAARGKYLVFLNNDTIPQQNWLAPLVQEVEEHPEVGVVGSKLLYPDGTIQHAGVVFSRDGAPYHIYQKMPADWPAVNRRREFQAVTGACLLMRRGLFEAVGGFDEKFINGFEDVDLCLKVRERGKQVIYQPRSVLFHLESQTPGRHANESDNFRHLRERWKDHWWVVDLDLHYYIDGYKLVEKEEHGKRVGHVVPLTDRMDRAAWSHVAATQRAAFNQDWAAVRREISLVNEWPADVSVLVWAAEVAKRMGEVAHHRSFLERTLELDESPASRVLLARAALEEKKPAQADLHLAKLLAYEPRHAEGLLLRGILEMQREQYQEAEKSFACALNEGADRRKCLMGMGMAALGRSYVQGAWERFCEVLADYPDDPEVIHWLLRTGTAQNRWEELSRHLKSYVKRNPGDLATRFALSGVLLRADRIEEARQEQEAIRALDPAYDGLAELEQAIAKQEAVLAMEATEG